MIREGKWYVGKDGSKRNNTIDDGYRERTKGEKEMTNSSTDTLSLPGIQKKKGSHFQTTKTDHHIDFLTPPASGDKKKKNRRITFKMDKDELETDGASNTSLDSHDGRLRGRHSKQFKGDQRNGYTDGNDDEERARRDSVSSASDVNSGSSTTLLHRGEERVSSQTNGEKGLDLSRIGSSRKRRGVGEKRTKRVNDSIEGGHTSDIQSVKSRQQDKPSASSDQLRTQSQHSNLLVSNQLDSSGNREETGRPNDSSTLQSIDSEGKSATEGEREGGRNRRKLTESQSSSQRGSRTNLSRSNSQYWGGEGGGGGGTKPARKERELVQGKGYMRASSPSQSDWGDPTHARIWASNTASSSRVSLAASNGCHGDDNDEEEVENAKELLLPPIINRKYENPFGSLSLLDGFELTRAFTFSYH